MKIYYSNKFAKEFKRLPFRVKDLAEKKEIIFKKDQFEPSLKTHKLTGKLKEYWSFSIDHQYRIIFEFKENDIIWFHSIGTHEIYN